MSIMELGALGEFVGSIGVIATLIYLAIQVRQTKNLALNAAVERRSEATRDLFLGAAASDGLTTALAKADTALEGQVSPSIEALIQEGLSREEALRVFWFNASMGRHYQSTFRAELPTIERREFDQRIVNYFRTPTGRFFWTYSRQNFAGDFAEYVEGLLERSAD